jgi:hypothetical protein
VCRVATARLNLRGKKKGKRKKEKKKSPLLRSQPNSYRSDVTKRDGKRQKAHDVYMGMTIQGVSHWRMHPCLFCRSELRVALSSGGIDAIPFLPSPSCLSGACSISRSSCPPGIVKRDPSMSKMMPFTSPLRPPRNVVNRYSSTGGHSMSRLLCTNCSSLDPD